MLSALEEFAAHGIAGTTISRLTVAAGARNPSALHYHFGSKAALVEELIVMVQDWFGSAREPALSMLEARKAAGDAPALREVLELFVRPYARIIREEPWGLAAIRFIAIIEFEQEQVGWESLYNRTAPVAQRFLDLMLANVPARDRKIFTRRALFFIDAVIQGFATHEHTRVSFFGDLHLPSIDELADFHIDCGERLLSGRPGESTRRFGS